MSLQSLQSFREKVNGNPDLEAAIKGCLTGPSGAVDADAVSAIGKRNGFDFSAEDVRGAMSGAGIGAMNDELSDFELEVVSAGNPINCSDESGGG
jgi:predicted ribosomally synthesized peptide with nif11-like leader